MLRLPETKRWDRALLRPTGFGALNSFASGAMGPFTRRRGRGSNTGLQHATQPAIPQELALMNHVSPRATTPIPASAPSRPRAPLTGVVAGLALLAGLGAWTAQRIGEAKTAVSEVEARRSADSERAAALAREPQPVAVVRGSAETWQPRVDLDGTLAAERSTELGFKLSGRLARVHVKVGDRVRAGATLAELDVAEAAAQASASEAQMRAAEASLALAEDAERRTLPLVQNGSFAEASGVQASSQRALAVAQRDAARAQLELARAALSNHRLVAPFAGTVTRAPSGVGGVVSPGQTLFEVVDTSTLKLATTVTEDDANLLAEGAEIHVATERGTVMGRVTAILATLDARTRRVPVVAEFDNAPSKAGESSRAPLRAGAFVRAWVATRQPIGVLRVPHAVLRPGARDEAFAINPATETLEARHIVYAIAPDGSLLVRQGLRPDDQLVVSPIAEAKAGDRVRLYSATPEATEAPAREAGTP
jgi:RND family efflux transporter MFP subunit